MLAQIALVSFALLAILSLVIDVGLARVTQGQMQTAADVAVLEGLRHRDVAVLSTTTGRIETDSFASDCIRRTAAHRVVRLVFDDDLDPAFEDPDYAFGAGPIIDLTEGVTNLHGLQTISVPDPRVYEPNLQLNQQNAVEGDMVSGSYSYSADPTPSEGADYFRNDFNPSAPQPAGELTECPAADDPPPSAWPTGGSGSLRTGADNAFLVRLRRSNEFRDLPGQTVLDVASSGPSLPFLFGRGSTLGGDDPAFDYSPRRDGLTVRATAIAELRPAMRVGLPRLNPPQTGVTPFTLVDTYVQTLNPVAVPVTLNPANGLICSAPPCANANSPTLVGRFVVNLTNPNRIVLTAISTVGQPVSQQPVPVPCPPQATVLQGFGPVYSQLSLGGNRIIGFIGVELVLGPAGAAGACPAMLLRDVQRVPASNATAAISGGLTVPPGTPPELIRELLDKHFERNGAIAYGPVLVPVLAR